jgi:hypothetical protein
VPVLFIFTETGPVCALVRPRRAAAAKENLGSSWTAWSAGVVGVGGVAEPTPTMVEGVGVAVAVGVGVGVVVVGVVLGRRLLRGVVVPRGEALCRGFLLVDEEAAVMLLFSKVSLHAIPFVPERTVGWGEGWVGGVGGLGGVEVGGGAVDLWRWTSVHPLPVDMAEETSVVFELDCILRDKKGSIFHIAYLSRATI